MSLHEKLKAWEQAGLIDAAAADKIRAFEQGRSRPVALYAFVGLGALAIGVGLIAIVAANWQDIPPRVKLGVDLLLGLALALAAYRSWRRELFWPTETAVLVYYGFVLASIGLIGQVYQLSAPIHEPLLLWSTITAPFMLLSRSRFGAALWLAGLATTYGATAVHFVEKYGDYTPDAFVVVGFMGPIVFVLLSRIPWLRKERPRVAGVFGATSWAALVGSSFLVTFFWYERPYEDEIAGLGIVVCLAVTVALAATTRTLFGATTARERNALVIAFAAYGLSWAGPWSTTFTDLDLLGAVLGLLVLSVFAWVAVVFVRPRAFRVLTFVIAVRIVTIYFEVFGSLLSTGLGLLSGGVVVLLVAWLWWRISSRSREEPVAQEQQHAS